ncbi:MAG: transporter [Cardiobacteriaceae bacterium]|nr:transporter [Cardiobacteriaceae bacterium]
MEAVFTLLSDNSVLLLFFIIGLGMLLGKIRILGISLGSAMVLFLAIFLAALANHYGQNITVHKEFSTIGLCLFAFAIGINSGPSFFASLRTAVKTISLMLIVYVIVACVAIFLGKFFGLESSKIAGTFAGALTNTPALEAAATDHASLADATVAYSIAYLFGVLGMMMFAAAALNYGKNDTDTPAKIITETVRIEREDNPRIGDLLLEYGEQLSFSRLQRAGEVVIDTPYRSDHLNKDDLLTIVGSENIVKQAILDLGHKSSHNLQEDRKYLDFRRITISDPRRAGKTISELHLPHKFDAIASRVRRGDIELPATTDLVLQLGDRIRIVAPASRIKEVSRFFGDSSRGFSSINPIALGIGMVLGMLIGSYPISFGKVSFSIGMAAGVLIVGLIMGRIGRIYRLVTALPYTACTVLSELGLLLFFAATGLSAGNQILNAFSGDEWWKIFILGVAITCTQGIGMYLLMRYVLKIGGTKLSGIIAGAQTQPAVLAYCNNRTNSDPRVALGYALVYPAAMVGKILTAKFIGIC